MEKHLDRAQAKENLNRVRYATKNCALFDDLRAVHCFDQSFDLHL